MIWPDLDLDAPGLKFEFELVQQLHLQLPAVQHSKIILSCPVHHAHS